MGNPFQFIVIDETIAILVYEFEVGLYEEGILWILECALDTLLQFLKRCQISVYLLILLPFIPDGMQCKSILVGFRKGRKGTV